MVSKRYGLMFFLVLAAATGSCSQSSAQKAPPGKSPLDGAYGAQVAVAPQILVDQFGYRPNDDKVAVIRNPQVGFDKDSKFQPGERYELRKAETGAVAFAGQPHPWNGGAMEVSSGDNGWWFDFSGVKESGRYFVYDAQKRLRSPTFSIHPRIYHSVLMAAMRTFYYQRSGMAKRSPFADTCWNDDVAYAGPNQDGEARDVTDRGNPAKVRDLSGGWFDAGDTNKYVTFAAQPCISC